MQFADHVFTYPAGRQIPIRVTAGVLYGLWCAGSGPQTAEAMVEAHSEMICDIAAEKLAAGQIEDGEIVIRDYDLDF